MIIQLKIEKEHFYFIVILIAALFVIGVNAYTNPITHVGHDANETGPGIFGGAFTEWFTFPGNLRINNTLNLSGNITFENKAKITAPTNILLNTSNVTIQANLTLGRKSRDSWPSIVTVNLTSCGQVSAQGDWVWASCPAGKVVVSVMGQVGDNNLENLYINCCSLVIS